MSGLPSVRGDMKTEDEKRKASLPRIVRDMAARIVSRFDPDKIILFGSHARGEAGPDSDVDLLVIMEVTGSRLEAAVKVRGVLGGTGMSEDVVVATQEEAERFRLLPGHVIRAAMREGIVLHERRAG